MHLFHDATRSKSSNALAQCYREVLFDTIFDKHPHPRDTSSTFDVMRFSAARTTPSTASTPMAAPALEIASMAYSTWYKRPSGLKMVVLESYLRAITAS